MNQSKFFTTQAEASGNQLTTIEEQILLIETTRNQNETFEVLEKGNKVLKELQMEVNIERWERISDDMKEMK